ncbi:flippase [Haloarchaeobius sp. DYHT-AS-18]|uniref:flippase n=1 Tax=Haloarchaeobius sp. DYHT-AS-18 TaxID=3446117 RepID=UPI003EB8CD77
MADSSLRELLKGSGLVFVGRISELGISFAVALIVARELGKEGYGTVSLGATVLAVVSTLVVLGTHTGVGRYLPRYEDPAKRRGILVSAFQLTMPLGILAGAAVFFSGEFIATNIWNDESLAPILRLFGLAIPFGALVKYVQGAMQGSKLSGPKVIVQNITLPLTRLVLAAGAVLLGYGVLEVASAYAAAFVVASVLGVYYLYTRTPLFSREPYEPMHRELLGFSLPLVVTILMARILGDLDIFLLASYSTTAAVGVYNVIYPISNLVLLVLSSVAFLTVPILSELHSEDEFEEMDRMYKILTKWVFISTLPIFLFLALFPTISIRYTFGQEYVGGSLALVILSAGFFFRTIMGPNRDTLTAIGHTRMIMYDNITAATTNVVLNVLLIPRYQLVGAALATAISYIVLNILYGVQLYRRTGIQPFSTPLVKPALVAGVVISVLYYGLRTNVSITLPISILALTCFLLVYGLALLRFGGIENEDVELVLDFEDKYDVDLGPLKTAAKRLM